MKREARYFPSNVEQRKKWVFAGHWCRRLVACTTMEIALCNIENGAAAISGLKRGPVQTRSSKLVYFKQLYFTAVRSGDRSFPSKNPQPDRPKTEPRKLRCRFFILPPFLLQLFNPVSSPPFFPPPFFALLPRDILNITRNTSANIFIIPVSHGWRKDGADFSLLPKFREPENADISSPGFPSSLGSERERDFPSEWKVSRGNFPPVGRTVVSLRFSGQI